MASKVCPNCNRAMKQQFMGLLHCKCGTSWLRGKGFFQRTPDMQFKLEDRRVSGKIKKVPVIEYVKSERAEDQEPVQEVQTAPAEEEAPVQEQSEPPAPERTAAEEKPQAPVPATKRPYHRKAYNLIRGGIYYIQKGIPTGHEQHAGRPAVVVSDIAEGDFYDVVTIVYLTTQDKRKTPTRTPITSSGRVSTALAEQVDTVDVRRVGVYMGLATPREMTAIKRCLASHLGMTYSSYLYNDSTDTGEYIKKLEARIESLEYQLREQTEISEQLRRKLQIGSWDYGR